CDLPPHGDDGVRGTTAGHDAHAAWRRAGGNFRVAGWHRLFHAALFRDLQSGGVDGPCLDARAHGNCAQRIGAPGRGALLALEGLTRVASIGLTTRSSPVSRTRGRARKSHSTSTQSQMMIYDDRKKRLLAAIADARLDMLVVYGNAWQSDYLRYTTDYSILEGQALALVRADGQVTLYLDSPLEVDRAALDCPA